MAVFLGVSRNLGFQALEPGSLNFWCVSGTTRSAVAGDTLLLYFPRSVSEPRQGIRQIYEITSAPKAVVGSPCSSRGMLHVDTQLIANLAIPLTAKDLKAHPIVSRWGAVSRNFQGVTFAIDRSIWMSLRSMVIEKNPDASTLLPASQCQPESL